MKLKDIKLMRMTLDNWVGEIRRDINMSSVATNLNMRQRVERKINRLEHHLQHRIREHRQLVRLCEKRLSARLTVEGDDKYKTALKSYEEVISLAQTYLQKVANLKISLRNEIES